MKPSLWLLTLLVTLTAQADGRITLQEGWVREAPPSAKVMAGYGRIQNAGSQPWTLCEARSPDFGAVEFHSMVEVNGQMRMRAEDTLEIPAQGELKLAPGGLHFMLFRPVRPLKAGDTVTLQLGCSGEVLATAQMPVKSAF